MTVILIASLAAALWQLVDILLLLFGSVLFAVLLRAIADPLRQRLGLGESAALALSVLVVAGILTSGAILFRL